MRSPILSPENRVGISGFYFLGLCVSFRLCSNRFEVTSESASSSAIYPARKSNFLFLLETFLFIDPRNILCGGLLVRFTDGCIRECTRQKGVAGFQYRNESWAPCLFQISKFSRIQPRSVYCRTD